MRTETKTYKQRLDEHYKEELQTEMYPYTKYHFLSDYVFNFLTYDREMDSLFSIRMVTVIRAILKNETFDYIEQSQSNYETYLTMINMPFLVGTLNWGGSIRGAWFDEVSDMPLYLNPNIEEVPKEDVKRFMGELLEWVEE